MFPKLENILKILVLVHEIYTMHCHPSCDATRFTKNYLHLGNNTLGRIGWISLVCMWGDICAMWHVAQGYNIH